MAISIPRTGAASPFTLAALAERYGDLPAEYIDFVANHDGATPPPNVLEETNYGVCVSRFLPSSQIIDTANSIEGLPTYFMPFGEDDSGNFICLSTQDRKVHFWDHEIENDTIVACNFKEFVEKLEPFDQYSIKLKPGQVKRVWANPDFKPEF